MSLDFASKAGLICALAIDFAVSGVGRAYESWHVSMLAEHFRQSPLVDELDEASSPFSIEPGVFCRHVLEVNIRPRTLRMLRATLSREKSLKIGRIEGRQAPTTPREDSTIGQ